MIRSTYFNWMVVICIGCLLIGCASAIASPAALPSTATPLPIATWTETSTITPNPTERDTPIPTETSIPLPASLIGSVTLSGNNSRPLVGSVELREAETFDLIAEEKTNSRGEYSIENIQPGKYELWVLITTKPAMVAGCYDIRPPDAQWKIGVSFEGDKALTMENAFLSKALLLVDGLQGSGLQSTGFYAVLPDFEVVSGIENKFDVALICD